MQAALEFYFTDLKNDIFSGCNLGEVCAGWENIIIPYSSDYLHQCSCEICSLRHFIKYSSHLIYNLKIYPLYEQSHNVFGGHPSFKSLFYVSIWA